MTELAFLGIAEASRLIAARKLSPVELTEACLQRIANLDSQLDSFVTLTADRARAEAKAAEAAIMASGPVSRLHGIPYCLKDIFDTAGIRTTAMSKLLADNVPARDAHCQEKLAAAGGVLLGKNATWEFAHGGPSWDVLFPPARNPVGSQLVLRPARPRAPPPLSRRASRPRPWAAIPAVRSADRPPPAASPA